MIFEFAINLSTLALYLSLLCSTALIVIAWAPLGFKVVVFFLVLSVEQTLGK